MSLTDPATGPFCTALGCRADADVIVRVDGRERPLCAECADVATATTEVIADV